MAEHNTFLSIFDDDSNDKENATPGKKSQHPVAENYLNPRRFPEKLWEAACDQTSDLIAWSEDGVSITVSEKRFEDEILAAYPGLVLVKSFNNFRRQLREYGFDWRQDHEQRLFSFSHPCFRRDEPDLLKTIATRRRIRSKLSSEGSYPVAHYMKTKGLKSEMQYLQPQSAVPFAVMPMNSMMQSGQTYFLPRLPFQNFQYQTAAAQVPLGFHAQEFGDGGASGGDAQLQSQQLQSQQLQSQQLQPPQLHLQPHQLPQPLQQMLPMMMPGVPYGLFFQQYPWVQSYGSMCYQPAQISQGDAMQPSNAQLQQQQQATAAGQSCNSTIDEVSEPEIKKPKFDFG